MGKSYKYLLVTGLIILAAGVIIFAYPFSSLQAENEARGRIAYVDVWSVFNAHPQKAIAEQKLNQLAQSMQAELEEKAKDLPKEEQQKMLEDYQNQLDQKEQALIDNIIATIEDVIQTVAQEKEVKMVLDKKYVIYGGYDMTQDVIKYIEANTDSQTSLESQDTTPKQGNSAMKEDIDLGTSVIEQKDQ